MAHAVALVRQLPWLREISVHSAWLYAMEFSGWLPASPSWATAVLTGGTAWPLDC
jgi:hypothetical protein